MKNGSKKRKKKFYNDHRNSHWTEEPTGREIPFADKYANEGVGTNKYEEIKRTSYQVILKQKEKKQKRIKSIISILICAVVFCTGYVITDIHMIRNAKPAEQMLVDDSLSNEILSELVLNLSAQKVDSISLDGSVMLDATIQEVQANGMQSIIFDAKRTDGTIGYNSSLAEIDTYGAITDAATDTKTSVKILTENDILPVARISCYKDNVAPAQNAAAALTNGDRYYTYDDSTYLNPSSEEAYSYIRDIVRELHTYGVSIFLLTECNLPEDISGGYDDGFKSISDRLTNDLGDGIKLIEEIDVSISGTDEESGRTTNSAIKEEIESFPKLKKNQIYYITSNLDKDRLVEQLANSNITNYIIGE